MTTEQKARAYDEALKLARDYHEDKNCFEYLKGVLEHIFYELQESEDERTRKQILNYFVAQKVNEPQPVLDSWITWLEKQASKLKWTEEDSLMIDAIIDTIKWLAGKGDINMKIDWLMSLKQRMEEQTTMTKERNITMKPEESDK